MGGEHTEIGDDDDRRWPSSSPGSSRSASPPASIRTGLRSDASARWERGVDPYGIDTAIARFVELLGETCPGLVVHAGAVDARAESLPAESRRTPACGSARSTGSSASTSPRDDVAGLLDPIGFTVTGDDPEALDRRAAELAPRCDGGDRRHRGGRPPLRLRERPQARAAVAAARPPQRRSSSAAAGSARCSSGSASPR